MSNNVAENKTSIRNFFDAINQKDFKTAYTNLHDDLDWFLIGRTSLSGHNNKREMQVGFKILHKVFANFSFTLHELTGEEDRVSVTAESSGDHKSGRHYNNHYHFLFEFKDGKFFKVKEYLDTEHAIWIEKGD